MRNFIALLLFITASVHFPVKAQPVVSSVDKKAQEIANASVAAMGGRDNYNNTRYISWLFFGSRFHVWDKFTGDIRIEYDKGNVLLMNIHTKKGRVWEQGKELKDEKMLAEKMNWGYEVWINDSYWVVMPFKLHDDGVNLAYTRQDKSLDGQDVDVLTMTFNDVGVTPDNKYEVFFDKQTHLIKEFAFYPTVNTNKPRFRLPWANWQQYGTIKLADNRGKSGMTPISVFDELPQTIFTSPQAAKDNQGEIIKGALIK
ncbi:hypothetical protein MHM98_03275 [Psychrobium sp. MM17-31]|uniref:DUF6503 family protein n=1 Tax=Psychrobium sp. MM17-31 TaxID=2917758 RepID=UPI001EF73AA6|nr:DUF6503 family protein [Psychrobium sp. MM17-31]MCG7530381.1 hypothetical protein [Psychrobium sp. MM17-31]